MVRAQLGAHRPRRLLRRFLVHEEISAVLTPPVRIAALVVVLVSYFFAVFWPLEWRLPRQVLNQVEIGAEGQALFDRPGVLRSYAAPEWLAEVKRGAPLRVRLDVLPGPPHPRFLGRLFAITLGWHGRLLSIDRDQDVLLVHLRAKGTNLDGYPPLRARGVFQEGRPLRLELALVGPELTVQVDGRTVIRHRYRDDPRRRWISGYKLALGSDINMRRFFLGEISFTEVRVGERAYDLLAPGVLSRPHRIVFLDREPRLVPFQDIWTRDAWENVLGFVPLGVVAAIWPGATLFSVLATGLAISGSIEFIQLTVPGRVPSVDDVITNTTGAFCGWLLIFFLRTALDAWGRRRAVAAAAGPAA
ncbi:VanZ family protein [Geminicoccus flavidas]|uniref:VanZ family protein n=1 Tax=Geminicoccus flavidas TaxID=2506407 RepID=UPI001F477107|nr:VanZ family protein [Geminicoccus flavidas]